MRGYGLKRLFLHAGKIAFAPSSDSEEIIEVEAPLEASLENTLKQLDLY